MRSPTAAALSSSLSSSMMRMVSMPARIASGLPPNVVPWLPGPKHVLRALRPAPRSRPPARPSPGPWPAASRRARCRPTGARTTCRCGPCRTAPRRASAASRFSSHSARSSRRYSQRVGLMPPSPWIVSRNTATTFGLVRATSRTAPMSFSGTRTKPSTSGSKPALHLGVAGRRQGGDRAAVEGFLVDDDLGPLRCRGRGRTCVRS